jgi:hypothetical protein
MYSAKQIGAMGVFLVALVAGGGAAVAQNSTGAQKSAAASGTAVVFGPFTSAAFNSFSSIVTPFQDVLVTNIKPPGGKDLFINVSMETGIFAFPQLDNQAGFALTAAQPDTQLQVRVLFDCLDCAHPYTVRLAEPGTVNFDNLFRAVLRVTSSGFDALLDTLDQLGVRTFAFVARDVGVGIHTVRVQARFVTASSSFAINGFSFDSVQARIGARTVTVEEVMLDAQ